MKHHLSDQHPLQPVRVKLAMDLIRSTGLIEHAHLVPPRRATIHELELVHSRRYIELVRKLSDPKQRGHLSPDEVDEAAFAAAANPVSDELPAGAPLLAGATLVAPHAVESRPAPHP